MGPAPRRGRRPGPGRRRGRPGVDPLLGQVAAALVQDARGHRIPLRAPEDGDRQAPEAGPSSRARAGGSRLTKRGVCAFAALVLPDPRSSLYVHDSGVCAERGSEPLACPGYCPVTVPLSSLIAEKGTVTDR